MNREAERIMQNPAINFSAVYDLLDAIWQKHFDTHDFRLDGESVSEDAFLEWKGKFDHTTDMLGNANHNLPKVRICKTDQVLNISTEIIR